MKGVREVPDCGLAYYVTDIAWGVLESQKLARLLFVDTSAYYVAMAAGVALWTQYIVTYLDEKGAFPRLFLRAGRVVAGLVTLLTIVNVFHPIVLTVDEGCVYHALGLRYAILACQIMLLLSVSAYALVSIVRRHEATTMRKRYRTPGLFGLIMGACLVVQLWFPFLPLYAIAYMLGTCLLRAFVIGDEKEEYRRGLEEATKVAGLKRSIASLLDNMPALSFSKDVETGVYLACNQAFATYAHKASPAGVVGLTDQEIFDGKTAAHLWRKTERRWQWIALTSSTRMFWTRPATGASSRRRS